MKKIFTILILTILFLGGSANFISAGGIDYNSSRSNITAVKLPPAGWTPNSSFYFLEKVAESIREFFTFNPEAKAKLQAKRALERIAEVKAMLAEKEINPKGIDVALSRLQANVAKAASIIQKEQKKGKNVYSLAKKLDTDFEIRNRLLNQTLGEKSNQIEIIFKQQKIELKKQLIDAKIANDAQKVGEIVLALDKLENEKESLESLIEQRQKEMESVFEAQEEKFEQAQEEKERKLEQKEKEAEYVLEKKKEELEKQFEKAEEELELKEELLEDQFDIAFSLGNKQDIERIKAQLFAIKTEQEALDAKFEESEKAFEKAERDFEELLMKKDRTAEDFKRQEELTAEKADFEMEKFEQELKEKEMEMEREKLERNFEQKEKQREVKKEIREN